MGDGQSTRSLFKNDLKLSVIWGRKGQLVTGRQLNALQCFFFGMNHQDNFHLILCIPDEFVLLNY
jgi:hypothetical protein